MDFFNKLKNKLRFKESLLIPLFLLFISLMVALVINTGFSSEILFHLTVRGASSGIPIPNWLISCFGIIMSVFILVAIISTIKSIKECKDYKKIIAVAESIGGVEAVGTTIAALEKSKLTKGGDLRYNQNLLFYSTAFSANLIPASNIRRIGSRIERSNYGESVYVCVVHSNGELSISSNKKKALLLIEDLRKTYGLQ